MDDALQDTIDYVAITRLQSAYADAVTRREWAELDDLFLPDAPIRVDMVTNPAMEFTGPREIGDFIGGAIERFEFFEFVPLNTTVDLRVGGDATRARGRLYICELRQDAATGHASQAFGVYHDEYRSIAGRWWFASRAYQSLTRTGRNEVFPFRVRP
jgi:hypothetical protein